MDFNWCQCLKQVLSAQVTGRTNTHNLWSGQWLASERAKDRTYREFAGLLTSAIPFNKIT